MLFLDHTRAIEEDMIEWRRDIHAHPELGFEETRTSKFVAETLEGFGLPVQVKVGKTGVVAKIGSGRPAIGIRADMDALPIIEANDVAYKSQTSGVMHACGHDAHTAMLLGVAKVLSGMSDLPAGEIRLLFQPSEEKWDNEIKSGATRMIEDGALEGLDAVIALHVDSTMPVGQVGLAPGYALAAVDEFHATIFGEGTHGATPDKGIDPVYLAAQVVVALQAVRSRWTDPISASVVTVGAIHGGVAANVIPDRVELRGTIRSFDPTVRDELSKHIERTFELVKVFGGDYELVIERGYPALYNDPEITELVRSVAAEYTGEGKTKTMPPSMGAEDFAYMAQKAPGMMFMLGAKFDEVHRPHHSPIFNISEEPLKLGSAILADAAVRLLKKYGA